MVVDSLISAITVITASLKKITMLLQIIIINEMPFTVSGCPSSCECTFVSRKNLELVITVKKGRKLTALPGNIPSNAAVM